MGALVGAVAVLAAAGAALAESTGPVRRSSETGGTFGGVWEWLQMLLALAVVVGLIFAARYLLKRLAATGRGLGGLGGAGAVEVVARTSLSMKHQLIVVRLGRRLVLLGTAGEGLTKLAEVTDPAEIDAILAAAGKTLAPKNQEGGKE